MPQRGAAREAIGTVREPEVELEQLQAGTVTGLQAGQVLEDVLLDGVSLHGVDAGSVRIQRACLRDVDLGEARLRGLALAEVLGERVHGANGDWGGCRLRHASLQGARLTGLDLAEASIENASFRGCKLDYANFRHATIAHALFEDCVLRGADFQGAQLRAVRFAGCELAEADFSKAKLTRVDLRGSALAGLAGSVLALAGAIVDSLQLIELAPALAHELGIVVSDA
jgi:uncharacterized protein YjbI with pentapeptide repeats